MQAYQRPIVMFLTLACLFITGCAGMNAKTTEADITPPPPRLTSIEQIDSFNVKTACSQGFEVVTSNPYSQELFEKVFARIVEQAKSNKSPRNADIIWDNFVVPLEESGKVPPDLAKRLWNCYFSRQFVSLPSSAPVTHYCHDLTAIKKALEKEYQLKKAGFEVCEQGSPDAHFLNAMYVYNTMWAACQ